MNGNNSTTETTVSERLSDSRLLAMQWKTIDWKKAEQEVNRLQVRIVKATQEKKWNAVKRFQYLLTHSFYAKALAVRRVTTNKGKKTAGVDGAIWSTPAMKMRAVLSLTDNAFLNENENGGVIYHFPSFFSRILVEILFVPLRVISSVDVSQSIICS